MRLRDRVTLGASAAAIATSVLAIGGAPRWSLALIAVPVIVAVGAQVTSRRGFGARSPLLVLAVLAFGLTALQALPLPEAAQATLAPPGRALVHEGQQLLGDSSSFLPLSLDPPGTRRAALDLLLAVALAWALLRIAASPQGRYAIVASVAGVCGLAAAIGAIDHLLGATDLYGLYTPHRANPPILGPLLNPNSYGSLLVVGATLSGGLALFTQQANGLRAAWAVNVVLCLLVAFATLSRGAALAAGIGAMTLVLMWISGKRRRERSVTRKPSFLRVTVPATIVVICGLALVVLTSAGGVTKQIEDTSLAEYSDPLSKYAAWRSSVELVRESPWIGVGRGGFEAAFTRVHPESAFGTFSHLENEYLQAVVDWGLPGAAALALVAAWLAITAVQRRKDGELAAGAIGALAAVAAQATVDFGLELPGLMLPVVAIAATVAYVPVKEMSSRATRRAFAGRTAMLLALAALLVLVVPAWGRTLTEDHDLLEDDDPPTLAVAQDVMRRHPLDYFAPARAAIALFAAGDPTAIKNLNRALELHPTHQGLHRLAARILAATGHRAQGKLEYQLAMRFTQNPVILVGEVLQTYPDAHDAADALWDEFPNVEGLVKVLSRWHRPDVTVLYLQRVVKKRKTDVDLLDMLDDAAIAINDLDTAEYAASLRAQAAPGLTSTRRLGFVLRKRGKLDVAEQVLKEVPKETGAPEEQVQAWLLYCDVMVDRQEWPPAQECLAKLAGSSFVTTLNLRAIHGRLANIAEAMGDKHRAQMERVLATGGE